jgi:hypothetical protein
MHREGLPLARQNLIPAPVQASTPDKGRGHAQHDPDAADAAEPAELLQFLNGWLDSDQDRLDASLQAYTWHPAYGLHQLRSDLDRFAFLLDGNDGARPRSPS